LSLLDEVEERHSGARITASQPHYALQIGLHNCLPCVDVALKNFVKACPLSRLPCAGGWPPQHG
jgi:hypothetical protein